MHTDGLVEAVVTPVMVSERRNALDLHVASGVGEERGVPRLALLFFAALSVRHFSSPKSFESRHSEHVDGVGCWQISA